MSTPALKNCTVPVMAVWLPTPPPAKLGEMLLGNNETVAVKVIEPEVRELLPIAAPTRAPVGVPLSAVTVVARAITTLLVAITGR